LLKRDPHLGLKLFAAISFALNLILLYLWVLHT
jgi:hypothetical protein